METNRLKIYAASQEQMEAFVAEQTIDVLKEAYAEMEDDGIVYIPMEYYHFIDILQDKDDDVAYAATKRIAAESEFSDKYYKCISECTLLLALLFTVVTIFLSMFMSSTAAMGIQTGILMISFFNIPLKSELLNKLWGLRPTHYLNSWVDNYSLFDFGTLQLNSMQMATILYAIITIIIASSTIIIRRQ